MRVSFLEKILSQHGLSSTGEPSASSSLLKDSPNSDSEGRSVDRSARAGRKRKATSNQVISQEDLANTASEDDGVSLPVDRLKVRNQSAQRSCRMSNAAID
jgi:hypothetical protein